ncbi:hypothetical protein [Thiorhodovibrio frisius]|uniref:Uncharacterized protein n=1 Tax=Thiorhodovibrio frisius TaxID=631362 RepID=H8Z7C2_9GAMM|nr:hypothetical protein [Thiorhodovibrio frisius]EIC19838.1 hypothetical protein Thi970DRAFT_03442 [Thiorhodovibrio frisius]WPL20566.1 hypothetical protein Thiofri_00665 [Thiorhodovibrio frisius]
MSDIHYTTADFADLIRLNDRLSMIERYLVEFRVTECPKMDSRVADPDDPLADYELDAELGFYLREDDPEYREDEDNILTMRRWISLKHSEQSQLNDGRDHRLWNIGYPLSEIEQCSLMHDLWDHDYSSEQRALTPQEMLRIGEISVEIQVRHQMTQDVESGRWSE